MAEIPDAPITDRDVYITRVFAARRETVWRFWTEADLLASWFGPTGFHTPIDGIDLDVRAGGSWSLRMRSDETDEVFPMTSRITLAIPPSYLEMVVGAQTSVGELEQIMLRVQFHDHGERTRITLHQGPFDDPTARELTVEGWNQSFDTLQDTLGASHS